MIVASVASSGEAAPCSFEDVRSLALGCLEVLADPSVDYQDAKGATQGWV